MSELSERAVQLHADGCNCCQSVLLAMNEAGRLSNEAGMRLGVCFGGGMGRGDACGAVTGGLMALGLRYGPDTTADEAEKKRAKALSSAFLQAFQERFSSIQCRELLKANGRRICDTVIAGAVEIIESIENVKSN